MTGMIIWHDRFTEILFLSGIFENLWGFSDDEQSFTSENTLQTTQAVVKPHGAKT